MVILFTCVLVLSRLFVKGGCTCETRIIGTNSQILCGPRQTRKILYMWKRAGKRSSLAQGQDHDRHIREVLQENSRSSMYKVYDNVTFAKKRRKTEML